MARGYAITGVAGFLHSDRQGLRLVLRHDVDVRGVGVRPMLAIEARLGLASTWYFRWATLDDSLVREIRAAGGEVGLHYETLARVLVRGNIHDQAGVTPEVLAAARGELRGEVDAFRRRLGLDELTIASHGHPRNQEARVSNNVLATADFCREAGVLAEAYAAGFLQDIDCYVADTDLLINDGWAYGITLVGALAAGHRRICFLSHPNHWWHSGSGRIIALLKLVLRGVRRRQRSFRPLYDA